MTTRVRAALPLLLLAFLVGACGSDGERAGTDEAAPTEAAQKVDLAGWQLDLVSVGADVPDDMTALEELTRKDSCTRDADGWGIYLTLGGVDPDAEQLGVQYVCPERLDVFQSGLSDASSAADTAERLCSMTPDEVPAEEYDDYDAICQP